MKSRMDVGARLALRTEPEPNTGCWLWTGNIDRNGYGKIANAAGRVDWVHRVSYEHHVGPIPDGLELDHLCRLPCCVNPRHLEPVTHAENVRRGVKARRSHCANGHPFTPENLLPSKPGRGRQCHACKLISDARYRRRRGIPLKGAPHHGS